MAKKSIAKIISVGIPKGGPGKSTLAMCIAYSKAVKDSKKIKKVLLGELDDQGSLKYWHEERADKSKKADKVDYMPLYEFLDKPKKLEKILDDSSKKYDLLILDIPGESKALLSTQLALTLSDLIIVPIKSTTFDESSFEHNMLPTIAKVLQVDPGKNKAFYLLPSFVHPNANEKKIREYFINRMPGIIPDMMKCMKSVFRYRNVLENFNRDGINLHEYAVELKNSPLKKVQKKYDQTLKAIEDVDIIVKEVLGLLKI